METLKRQVQQNLENGGFLNQLRAQIKAQVYNVIESNNDGSTKAKVGFQYEHPLAKQLKGDNLLELIIEFLEFFKLEFTSSVLRKEVNITEPIQREQLATKMGVSTSNQKVPILTLLLQSGGLKTNNEQEKKQKALEEKQLEAKKLEEKKLEEKREQARIAEEKKKEERREEEKRKEEERKKEEEKKKRPQTAEVNKIRGPTKMNNTLSSMFGISAAPIVYDDIFDQPVKASAYDFDLDAPIPNKKTTKDPYAFDIDSKPKTDLTKTIGKKFNQFEIPAKGNDIEEDIEFQESRDDRVKQSNNMFTSDEDYMKATQSLGVDESVDSLALEEYDYYEQVVDKSKKKKK